MLTLNLHFSLGAICWLLFVAQVYEQLICPFRWFEEFLYIYSNLTQL